MYLMLHARRIWRLVETQDQHTLDKTVKISNIVLHLNETTFSMRAMAPELWTTLVSDEYLPPVDENRTVVCIPFNAIPKLNPREFYEMRVDFDIDDPNVTVRANSFPSRDKLRVSEHEIFLSLIYKNEGLDVQQHHAVRASDFF